MSHNQNNHGDTDTIKVMIRFRPQNKSEKAKANKMEPWKTLQRTDKGIRMSGNQLSLYNIKDETSKLFKKKISKFIFDELLDEKTTQIEAFEKVAQPICDQILQGYNGTIFVYGQSGSGKTHTMYGPEEHKNNMDLTKLGVIPQAASYVFEILNNPNHPLVEGMLNYKVQCEFVEIYNEKLHDLLEPLAKPKIRQIKTLKGEWKIYLQNVEPKTANNLRDVLEFIKIASKNRTVAGTNLNATSSRSHMLLRLIVTIETADGVRKGVGNFADLAGSEKVKKTGAAGIRLKEAGNILKSLSTLQRVIEALEIKIKNPKKHIPFQDSKLTFMLKNSLGGNCKTTLLIAASPHVFNRDETIRSLKFGERCRKIKNKAKINSVKTKAQLIKENDKLKLRIKELENNKINQNDFVMIDDKKQKELEKEKEKLIKDLEILKNENNRIISELDEFKK